MKSAWEKDQVVQKALESRGLNPQPGDANTLRRIELTLSRWCELECGTENGCIEHDEKTGIPYWTSARTGNRSHPVPDREKDALNRLQTLCKERGWRYYYQTDSRGCALYVSLVHINGQNYTDGAACCA
jgi:hypothetical protein